VRFYKSCTLAASESEFDHANIILRSSYWQGYQNVQASILILWLPLRSLRCRETDLRNRLHNFPVHRRARHWERTTPMRLELLEFFNCVCLFAWWHLQFFYRHLTEITRIHLHMHLLSSPCIIHLLPSPCIFYYSNNKTFPSKFLYCCYNSIAPVHLLQRLSWHASRRLFLKTIRHTVCLRSAIAVCMPESWVIRVF